MATPSKTEIPDFKDSSEQCLEDQCIHSCRVVNKRPWTGIVRSDTTETEQGQPLEERASVAKQSYWPLLAGHSSTPSATLPRGNNNSNME